MDSPRQLSCLKTCVYRIVQEALDNCSKHAYAKNERVGQMGGVLKVESIRREAHVFESICCSQMHPPIRES
jgi:signal transduction histidine kinase